MFGSCKDSKAVVVFVLARTVDHLYSFKGGNITFPSRSNESSENVMKVRVFPSFGPFFGRFTVEVAPKYFGT